MHVRLVSNSIKGFFFVISSSGLIPGDLARQVAVIVISVTWIVVKRLILEEQFQLQTPSSYFREVEEILVISSSSTLTS